MLPRIFVITISKSCSSAVELYSENLYLTKDIDMVDISYAKPAKLHKVMAGIGFEKRGRVTLGSGNVAQPSTVDENRGVLVA